MPRLICFIILMVQKMNKTFKFCFNICQYILLDFIDLILIWKIILNIIPTRSTNIMNPWTINKSILHNCIFKLFLITTFTIKNSQFGAINYIITPIVHSCSVHLISEIIITSCILLLPTDFCFLFIEVYSNYFIKYVWMKNFSTIWNKMSL